MEKPKRKRCMAIYCTDMSKLEGLGFVHFGYETWGVWKKGKVFVSDEGKIMVNHAANVALFTFYEMVMAGIVEFTEIRNHHNVKMTEKQYEEYQKWQKRKRRQS